MTRRPPAPPVPPHPIMGGGEDPWEFGVDLLAWRLPDGSVAIQGVDGDVTVPLSRLIELGRGLMAAAVNGHRPEWQEPKVDPPPQGV